jgi:hypothetical protein
MVIWLGNRPLAQSARLSVRRWTPFPLTPTSHRFSGNVPRSGFASRNPQSLVRGPGSLLLRRGTMTHRRVDLLQQLYSGFSQKLIKVSPLSSDSGARTVKTKMRVHFIPEAERLHDIIECVVSADELTSTPRKIVSSSVNNLTVWYDESAPISYRLYLFGSPSRRRIPHNYH